MLGVKYTLYNLYRAKQREGSSMSIENVVLEFTIKASKTQIELEVHDKKFIINHNGEVTTPLEPEICKIKENIKYAEQHFYLWGQYRKELLHHILVNYTIDVQSMMIYMNCTEEDAVECINLLFKLGLVSQRGKFYIKMPEFKRYLLQTLKS